MIKRFNTINGYYPEMITGQQRLGHTLLDDGDFMNHAHEPFAGGQIIFFDFQNGQVYEPFPKQRNVMYGAPLYTGGHYYFLQADFDQDRVSLYQYRPSQIPVRIYQREGSETDLYNLAMIDEGFMSPACRLVTDLCAIILRGSLFL